jgi:hypothetical protein
MNSNTSHIISEFIGTFVFLFTILQSGLYQLNGTPGLQPFVIVTGLLVAILMFGSISGGHFNPAVSVMLYLKGDGNVSDIGTIVRRCGSVWHLFKIKIKLFSYKNQEDMHKIDPLFELNYQFW